MEYSQVLLEMLERIKTLEGKVESLEEQLRRAPGDQPRDGGQLEQVSLKYRRLAEYLWASQETRVTLSYPQIEEILGFKLPGTAKKFKPSFWANTKTHSYASSWMGVGYKAQIDPHSDSVTFVKNLG